MISVWESQHFNLGIARELRVMINTMFYVNLVFLYGGITIAFSCFTFHYLFWIWNCNKIHLQSKFSWLSQCCHPSLTSMTEWLIFWQFRAFTLLHRLQINIFFTIKYFFKIQDSRFKISGSAQTNILTVFFKP